MRRFSMLCALLGFALVVPGCGGNSDATPPTMAEAVTRSPQFTTLATAVQAAGLGTTLQTEGPFTLFAPTDTAFTNLPAGTLDALLADPAALRRVLLYHVVPGVYGVPDLTRLSPLTTAAGVPLAFGTTANGVLSINPLMDNSRVTGTGFFASNGIIYTIDKVLVPPAP